MGGPQGSDLYLLTLGPHTDSHQAADLPFLPGPVKSDPVPFGERPLTWQQVYTWKV